MRSYEVIWNRHNRQYSTPVYASSKAEAKELLKCAYGNDIQIESVCPNNNYGW